LLSRALLICRLIAFTDLSCLKEAEGEVESCGLEILLMLDEFCQMLALVHL